MEDFPIRPSFPALLSPSELAALLNISVGTLAVWRCTRRYPLKYIKVGRAVRYRREDVEAFLLKGSNK